MVGCIAVSSVAGLYRGCGYTKAARIM